jgi:hypothetical protein
MMMLLLQLLGEEGEGCPMVLQGEQPLVMPLPLPLVVVDSLRLAESLVELGRPAAELALPWLWLLPLARSADLVVHYCLQQVLILLARLVLPPY